jgi:hypothetical protein
VHLLSGQPARIDAAAAHQCGTPCHQRTARSWLNAVQVTPDDPKTGPDRTIIYVVPVSWKVARLIWSYAHTSDLSFYNINNAKVHFRAAIAFLLDTIIFPSGLGSSSRLRVRLTRRTLRKTAIRLLQGRLLHRSCPSATGPGCGSPSVRLEKTLETIRR